MKRVPVYGIPDVWGPVIFVRDVGAQGREMVAGLKVASVVAVDRDVVDEETGAAGREGGGTRDVAGNAGEGQVMVGLGGEIISNNVELSGAGEVGGI